MRGLFTRSIKPPTDITPNPNDPASVPPSTVGPDQLVTPGDPHGVTIDDAGSPPTTTPPPTIIPSAWSGWPADWWPPGWSSRMSVLTDTAWACIDKNSSALASMPPFLVGAADSLSTDWLRNPQPDTYTSWEEFCKQLFWDYQAVGEAYVRATSFYSTGWPARFHVVPPFLVTAEMGPDGLRHYTIGGQEMGRTELLHLRYQSTVADAHGHGPLEAGRTKVLAASMLAQYGAGFAQAGGVPPSMLTHPDQLSPAQAAKLKADWVAARQSAIGEPAVLSGGITWTPTAINPKDMALLELLEFNEARIAVLLGVPPFLVGLASAGTGASGSLTYSNVTSLFDYHWRDGLRPMAAAVMAGLSDWLLPRSTTVELNSDRYVQAPAYERAQTYQILHGIQDASGPVLTVDEIRQRERIQTTPQPQGVLQ